MAITRAQQAKQMLQEGGMTFGVLSDKPEISREIEQKVIEHENEYMERTGKVPPEFYGEKFRIKLMEEYMDRQPKANGGGMLVQPGFGGTRQGYKGGQDASRGDFGSPSGNTGNTGGGSTNRERGIMSRGKGRRGTTGSIEGPDKSKVSQFSTYGKNKMAKNLKGPNPLERAFDFYSKYSPLGMVTRGLTSLFGGPKSFTDKFGYATDYQGTRGPSSVDDDDDNRGGGDGMPLYAQLGFPSQAAYLASLQPQAGLPAAVMPMQNPMDLNRIAYRFFADGGFLDDEDEPRQAYGLGSFVKKIVKKATTIPRKLVKTVKKVAKSPTGRLLLAVAAPYALGPAMASSAALSGFTAAQQAALISGATTGITQLASGEDLDLKDIALSAAIGGTSAKFLPPGGAKGIDPSSAAGQQRVASDIASGTSFARPNIADIAGPKTGFSRPNMFDISGPVRGGSGISNIIKNVTPDKTNIFTRIGEGLKNIKGSKALQFVKDNPTLSILGASGLAGLLAKQEQQEEPGELDRGPGIDIAAIRRRPFDYLAPRFAGSQFDFYAAEGGQAKKEPVAKKVMPLIDMDGMEKDYRETGGFVDMGRMEKADDVPARLSKNEFVFTADAVRNAGDGDVDKGAEVMYNMMKNLESGGDVSEESQGLEGARRMFQTSQRLEEVL